MVCGILNAETIEGFGEDDNFPAGQGSVVLGNEKAAVKWNPEKMEELFRETFP